MQCRLSANHSLVCAQTEQPHPLPAFQGVHTSGDIATFQAFSHDAFVCGERVGVTFVGRCCPQHATRWPPNAHFRDASAMIVAFSSHVRESMVKIMLTADPRQQCSFGGDDSERWQLDGICERGGLLEASNGRVSLMDPSTCTFWCAVALGALVRGSPLQSVRLVACLTRL